MTAPKFTPGPWFVADSYGPAPSYGSLVNAVSDSIEIASCCVHCSRDANANAHLIAAAPELYQALEDARDYVACALHEERQKFEGYEHASDIASIEADLAALDAALAKARGEA